MLLLALTAAALSPTRLTPVDECAADRSFAEFRAELHQTIERRDSKSLLSMVADDVQASLGGDIGKRDFIALWKLDRPSHSKIWKELGEALELGCTMRSGIATVPSMEDQIGDRDVFETRIALPGAVLRRRPNEGGQTIVRLNWHVLTLNGEWDGGPWIPVRLDDGRTGYVLEKLTRSPIYYRAWFQKRARKWIMAGFLAGD